MDVDLYIETEAHEFSENRFSGPKKLHGIFHITFLDVGIQQCVMTRRGSTGKREEKWRKYLPSKKGGIWGNL